MAEPSVQVPVSLIESLHSEPAISAYHRAVLRALLSQPEPSAEPITLHAAWQEGYDTGWMSRDNYGDPDDEEDYSNPYPGPAAEPPRIEDMAPETRACADPNVHRWYCQRRAGGACPLPKCIDPSTIRDVTPPPATPEETR